MGADEKRKESAIGIPGRTAYKICKHGYAEIWCGADAQDIRMHYDIWNRENICEISGWNNSRILEILEEKACQKMIGFLVLFG